jgi:hypothetical protein
MAGKLQICAGGRAFAGRDELPLIRFCIPRDARVTQVGEQRCPAVIGLAGAHPYRSAALRGGPTPSCAKRQTPNAKRQALYSVFRQELSEMSQNRDQGRE